MGMSMESLDGDAQETAANLVWCSGQIWIHQWVVVVVNETDQVEHVGRITGKKDILDEDWRETVQEDSSSPRSLLRRHVIDFIHLLYIPIVFLLNLRGHFMLIEHVGFLFLVNVAVSASQSPGGWVIWLSPKHQSPCQCTWQGRMRHSLLAFFPHWISSRWA